MAAIQGLLALIKPKELIAPEDVLISVLQRSSGNQAASGDDGDMNVNASSGTPSVFEYRATAGAVHLSRLNVVIVDGAITPAKFGGLSALTNGVLIQILDTDGTAVLQDFDTADYPIKRNADWGRLAGVDNLIIPAAGDDMYPIRWSLFKAGHKSLIRLALNQYFRVTISDDTRNITILQMTLQGVFE